MREGPAIHALFGYANHTPRGLLLGVQLTFLGLLFIGLININIDITQSALIAGTVIFIARLIAIYYDISLPRFRFKS